MDKRHFVTQIILLGIVTVAYGITAGAALVEAVSTQQSSKTLHEAAKAGKLDEVKSFLLRGADVNAKDKDGWTPLHKAIIANQKDIAKMLIEKGPDLDIKDNKGRTLHWWIKDTSHDVDVAVTDVSGLSNCVAGDAVPVKISVANQGIRRETFRVTLTDTTDSVPIGTQSVALSASGSGGMDNVFDLAFSGENQGDLLGEHVTFGDVNGDGFDDMLALGAYAYDNKRGRAYLHYGGANMDDVADKVFQGENQGDAFGSVGEFGDFNNDGYDDLIISACLYNSSRGRVYLYYGGPDMDTNADLVFEGEIGTAGRFGRFVSAGDINNDDYDDFVITADHYNASSGRVYLYYGGKTIDTNPAFTFDGEAENNRFGHRTVIGKDVNGDNYGDILIGAREYDGSGTSDQGRCYLYYGNTKTNMNTVCDKIFTGEADHDNFGSGVDLFDIDNDGLAEVIVAARFAENWKGRAYIYWGEADIDESAADVYFEGETGSNMGGDSVKTGYFNDDDYGDIIIGAYNYPNASTKHGRVYLFYGNTKGEIDTTPDHIFDGEKLATDEYFGIYVNAGDVNKDGYDDLGVAAWGYDNNRGRIYLFYNAPPSLTDVSFEWDTSNATPGKHKLKASIAPVSREEDVADNTMTATVEVKER